MAKVKLLVSKRGLLEVVGSLALIACVRAYDCYMMRHDVPNAVKETKAEDAEMYGKIIKAMDERRRKDNELFQRIIDSSLNNPK